MAILIPDVDHADCFLFLGMNPAVSKMVWLDIVADGWNRIIAAQARGADLIVVDPRETQTTRKANTHVRVKPGQDWALLLAIIKVVFEHSWQHQEDCNAASGVSIIQEIAEGADIADLSLRCGVAVEQIVDIATRFAKANSAVCVARTGISQNKNGTVAEWLSHVLNLITGRIDKQGGRYFSHGVFKDALKFLDKLAPPIARRSRIGNHEAISGAYPLAILADEILTPGEDQIRALIINGGNPVISGPDGARLDAAFEDLDLLVAIDFFQRESHRHADWLIPGSHFLERDEFYLLFSGFYDRSFTQLGRQVVPPPNGVKTEWDFYVDLCLAMKAPFNGVLGFNAVIRLSRKLAQLTKNPRLAFNVRWIWALIVKLATPLRWKDIANQPQGLVYGEKTYGHLKSALKTVDGKIAAAPVNFVAALQRRVNSSEGLEAQSDYPLQLVSLRDNTMMNSWLVETVKRKGIGGDFIEIHPSDAERYAIEDNQIVRVRSSIGQTDIKTMVSEKIAPGTVCIPHGWGSRLFDPVNGTDSEVKGVNRNLLIASDDLDELSGMPSLNGTFVAVSALQ
ncbi:molybdopterin-containing oxidoreductase family protein [Zhongshania marina]|nr:molybdopterin-dependent oxidoreductase [Marortus luteolus]